MNKKLLDLAFSKTSWLLVMIGIYNMINQEDSLNMFLKVAMFLILGTLITYLYDVINKKYSTENLIEEQSH